MTLYIGSFDGYRSYRWEFSPSTVKNKDYFLEILKSLIGIFSLRMNRKDFDNSLLHFIGISSEYCMVKVFSIHSSKKIFF